MLPALIDTLLDAHGALRARRPDLPERPRLAVVDAAGTPTASEFRLVAGAAAERGLDAVVAGLDELRYDGSTLYAGGAPVQLVYRRALAPDVVADDLPAAVRDGAACVVNPFRAVVASSKKILALLQDPRFEYLLRGQEAEQIRATLPWTRILRPGRATYGPWRFDLLTFVSDNRERLVLKPADDYGGRGVILGNETDQATWDGTIEAQAPAGDFIVQEYVAIPEEMFPMVEDGRVQMRLKRFNVNPFALRRPLRGDAHAHLRPGGDQRRRGRRHPAHRDRPSPPAAPARRGRRPAPAAAGAHGRLARAPRASSSSRYAGRTRRSLRRGAGRGMLPRDGPPRSLSPPRSPSRRSPRPPPPVRPRARSSTSRSATPTPPATSPRASGPAGPRATASPTSCPASRPRAGTGSGS